MFSIENQQTCFSSSRMHRKPIAFLPLAQAFVAQVFLGPFDFSILLQLLTSFVLVQTTSDSPLMPSDFTSLCVFKNTP